MHEGSSPVTDGVCVKNAGLRGKRDDTILFQSHRSFPAFPIFSSSCSSIMIVTRSGSTPSVVTSVLVNSLTIVRFCSRENPFLILIITTGIACSPLCRNYRGNEYLACRYTHGILLVLEWDLFETIFDQGPGRSGQMPGKVSLPLKYPVTG